VSGDDGSGDSPHGAGAADARSLAALLSFDRRHSQRAFTVILLAFVAAIIGISRTYDGDASLFPLLVAVPSLAMLLLLLGIQTVTPLREYAERFGSSSTLSDQMAMAEEESSEGADADVPIETVRIKVLATLGWIALIAVSILLLGHVVGLTISLLVVFHVYSDLSWPRAIVFALANVALLTGLFVFVFNARLYPGVLLG
jgi:hypothetical protein